MVGRIVFLGVPAGAIKLVNFPGNANDLITGWSGVFYQEPSQQEEANLPKMEAFGNCIILSIAMLNNANFARGQLCFVRNRLYYRFKESGQGWNGWAKII